MLMENILKSIHPGSITCFVPNGAAAGAYTQSTYCRAEERNILWTGLLVIRSHIRLYIQHLDSRTESFMSYY